jgi:hypothetical protein
MELKRHRLTTTFLKVFHECFAGRVPGFTKRLLVSKPYKEVFNEASKIAETRRDNLTRQPQPLRNPSGRYTAIS